MSLLELHNIHRTFGGVNALQGASFQINELGSVHALLGANGSGKSTLLRIATGQLQPDAGEIYLDGKAVNFASPRNALRSGIATVTQETTLAPDLTVAENVMMGRLVRHRSFGPIDWAGTRREVRDLLKSFEFDFTEDTLVRILRPDQQQMVEIARALSMNARILVLDEATSALTENAVQAVFRAVRNGSQRQVMSTIFVSHRMDEIYQLADKVTVLRDGQTISTRVVSEVDQDTLVNDMVGDTVATTTTRTAASRNQPDASDIRPCLQIEDLATEAGVEHASLTIAPGEIVGLTGLTRSGANELLEAIFGSRQIDRGRVLFDGEDITQSDISTAIRQGIGFVPADRKLQGVLLHMSVRHNLLIPSTAGRSRVGLPRSRSELALVRRVAESVSLHMEGPDSAVSTLSGGNQQKVVIGKWLAKPLKLLLLAEPSRGVDVNAKLQIRELLHRIVADGATVLFASTELDEVLELADRIVIMFQGRTVADLPRQEASEHRITSMMSGVSI